MKIIPVGDYYFWECLECGKMNITLWTRFLKGNPTCNECNKAFPMPGDEPAELEEPFSKAI